MSSQFDPSIFLDATFSEPLVKRPPLPAGEYLAMIGEVTSRNWTGVKDPSKSGVAFDVSLSVEVPAEVQVQLGLKDSTMSFKDSIMLDLTPGGMLDMAPGKNRRLRLYREALDMNKVGDIFKPRDMQGRTLTVKISHDIWNDEIQERIASVTKTA